ncbi:unnamed protein product [Thlaspi arvense]|uniref:J domain-containing protein n=1 Tax=Thlaspi arvense TaxID=13288 RepID=A0AAU9T6K8_THLAR|nr:unnamed protein product [Thlaspi arvense]
MSNLTKVEAKRAIDSAERKISENDYVGAKIFVNKAHNLYLELEGLKQVSVMIDVYISASDKINGRGEADWYGVLGVDPLADDKAMKKQYKKLAVLIHPDKNKFTGATEAFKLVLEAWTLLSDEAKRILYDQKRKSGQVKQKKSGMRQKPPKRKHEPDFSWKKPKHEPESEPDPETDSSSSKYERESTFWTKCNRCNTYCEFGRNSYLNKTIPCPNCRHDFVATEIVLEEINGRRVIRFCKSAYDTSSSSPSASASDSAKAAHARMKGWFEPDPEPKHDHGSSSE